MNKGKAGHKHALNDKTMADVCEAIIGAALLTHHEVSDYDNAVKAVTAMVDGENHQMTKWSDYYALYKKPHYQTARAARSHIDLAEQVAKKHDYRFRYPRLLRSAFIHPSYPFTWEKIPSYQRLEFLGDSLLDMASVNFLFHRFPNRDPQWLTEHKVRPGVSDELGMVTDQVDGDGVEQIPRGVVREAWLPQAPTFQRQYA